MASSIRYAHGHYGDAANWEDSVKPTQANGHDHRTRRIFLAYPAGGLLSRDGRFRCPIVPAYVGDRAVNRTLSDAAGRCPRWP